MASAAGYVVGFSVCWCCWAKMGKVYMEEGSFFLMPFPTKKCDCSLALLCYKEFKLCHLQTFWRCYMW